MKAAAALLLLPLAACTSSLASFERTLAAHDSATAALTQWCMARGIADRPEIVAQRIAEAAPEVPADVRALLDVDGGQAIAFRHVRLTCGHSVLSVAHNWFVPGRLTPEMNRKLETSETPFGRVIAPLGFTRERLASRRGPAEGCPTDTILTQRGLLRLSDGRPVSLVMECYTAANLQR